MAAWTDRVEQLLYEGEEVLMQVGGDSVTVVLTTHRVLAFTPETDGPNFRAVERPNVTGIVEESVGSARFLESGIKAIVVGIVLIVAGFLVNFDRVFNSGSVDPNAAGNVGVGEVVSMIQVMQRLLSLVDDALLVFGAVITVAGGAVIGYYLRTREDVLTIQVAGDEDVQFPAGELSESDRSKLLGAIGRS
ncbi:MAG: hypothetical protein ABEJ58_06775 [Halodesulfurarchaeum sp.]